ncbi:uncharacterized protein BKA78DRAFT_307765 [Phyllosticta capitalensis]|uniref:uncharacterized protein n=1 Tax=Phyllosticta capitalensis TaxID=121624 RepID=UPI0031325730
MYARTHAYWRRTPGKTPSDDIYNSEPRLSAAWGTQDMHDLCSRLASHHLHDNGLNVLGSHRSIVHAGHHLSHRGEPRARDTRWALRRDHPPLPIQAPPFCLCPTTTLASHHHTIALAISSRHIRQKEAGKAARKRTRTRPKEKKARARGREQDLANTPSQYGNTSRSCRSMCT